MKKHPLPPIIIWLITGNVFLYGQWQQTNGPAPFAGPVLSLAVFNNMLFAGTDSLGIFRSSDNGCNWTKSDSGITTKHVRSFATADNTLFVVTDEGLYFSRDTGSSWISTNLTRSDITMVLMHNGSLIAGTEEGGLFRSTDTGETWSNATSGLPNTGILSLVVHNDTLFAGTLGDGIFRSTDNGVGWISTSTGLTHTIINALASSGNDLIAGSIDNSIFLSANNGGTWTVSDFYEYSTCYPTVFSAKDSILLAGTDKCGILLSTDHGSHWSSITLNEPDLHIKALAVNDTFIFAGTSRTGIRRRPLSEITGPIRTAVPRAVAGRTPFTVSTRTPSGSGVTIEFTTFHSAMVTMTLFDPTGRRVVPLVNNLVAAGTHRFYCDTRSLSRGCYVLQLQTGRIIRSKTIRLVH